MVQRQWSKNAHLHWLRQEVPTRTQRSVAARGTHFKSLVARRTALRRPREEACRRLCIPSLPGELLRRELSGGRTRLLVCLSAGESAQRGAGRCVSERLASPAVQKPEKISERRGCARTSLQAWTTLWKPVGRQCSGKRIAKLHCSPSPLAWRQTDVCVCICGSSSSSGVDEAVKCVDVFFFFFNIFFFFFLKVCCSPWAG